MSGIRKLWTRKARPREIQTSGEVYSVAFLPDARHVVGCGQSKTIGHWQVDNGRAVGQPKQSVGYLLNVAVSKDGRFLACAGSSGRAEVWDIKTHKKVMEAGGAARVFGVDVSPDSTRFVTGSDQHVAVWSISTGQLLLGPLQHPDFVAAVKFSPSGDRIATATWERNSIRLYDSTSGQLLVDIPDRVSSPYNTSLAWSSDGRQLYAATYAGKIKCFHVAGSFLSWMEWDVQAGNQPVSIALARNGKFIAAASSRFISFWDTSTHVQVGPIIEQSERVWSIALSSNGHLASGGDDKKIIIRNLKHILPRAYCVAHYDNPPEPQTTSRTPIVQPNNPVVEVHRLETLLDERDKNIQVLKKQKDDLEETVQTLSTTLRTREQDLDELKEQLSNLKATVKGLRKQLSDAQATAQSLTKKLNEASEVAGQHKLESDSIKAAFDELKVKHETELALAQKSLSAGPATGPASSSNHGIGIAVFESWMRDNSITAGAPYLEGSDNNFITDYNALACNAFVQARSRNWSAAYEDAQKSVNSQLSAIGHIARTIAFVGQRDYKAAMRAFALVFRDGDPNENEFILVIWAVVSCLAGEYIDGILRVHDLLQTSEAERAMRNCIQAYMYVLLGSKYMTEGDYERAVQLFRHAQTSYSSHRSSRLEIISLISGWCFDGLEVTTQQYLRDALDAAGRSKNSTESLTENRELRRGESGHGPERTAASISQNPILRTP